MEFLIVVLVAISFFKEQVIKLIYFRFGVENRKASEGERRQPITGEVARLSNYYNHDLTDRLEKIQESSNKTVTLLEELKEYGIKIRKE